MARGYQVTPRRRALVAEAMRLREQGLLQREIAEVMGISRTVAGDLLTDPWREQANVRRLKYGGRCERCGTPTDGSGGVKQPAPKLCIKCATDDLHDNRWWNRERVLAAIERFAREEGRQPISSDWLVGELRPEYAPPVVTVMREFGSWSAAMKACGFESYVGIKTRGRKPLMYRVLMETEQGWRDLGQFAGSRKQAANEALQQNPPENGAAPRLALVAARSFRIETVTAVQRVVYEFSA